MDVLVLNISYLIPETLDRLAHTVVATDDTKIAECCRGLGADVIMTSESCWNGTERCNEALQKLEKNVYFSTVVTSLKPEYGADTNRVKCVVDNHGYAIYFSRGLIPYNKFSTGEQKSTHNFHICCFILEFRYWPEVYILSSDAFVLVTGQSYDSKFLRIYPELPPPPLQLEEDLEKLKVLENGYKMKVTKVNHDAHAVDTPGIESLMRERNIS
ncbi:hypothetical protein AAC387_Pa06g0327 [Persea americana]